VKVAPVAAIRRASVRCVALPTPANPIVICRCLDSATSSGSVFAGTESCTTMQCGVLLDSPIGMTSTIGSYPSLACTNGFTVNGPFDPVSNV
jgi:hypothetical protein